MIEKVKNVSFDFDKKSELTWHNEKNAIVTKISSIQDDGYYYAMKKELNNTYYVRAKKHSFLRIWCCLKSIN